MTRREANDASPQRPISDRFRGTRAAHEDETAEDYVEAIAETIAAHGEARVRDLVRIMGVSHVTVSRIVARLVREGLAVSEPYEPITLTGAGRRLAARARARHEVVLSLLLAMGVPRRQAEIDAEGIEHHVSRATIRAMRAAVKRLAPGASGGGDGAGERSR
jgi:DtxR family manganese transport transcriptional regulator